MILYCEIHGLPKLVWSQMPKAIKLEFEGVSHLFKHDGVNEGVNLEIEGVKKELTELYRFIEQNPFKRANEMTEPLGKAQSTMERYLKMLRDHDFIEFIGTPKTGGYQVKEKDDG